MASSAQANRFTPRELTDQMVREFITCTESLFIPSRPVDYLEFEKGLYANLIVKPIKRVARLLTADRELLVLFSSFHDQQPRTIETALNLIDASDGRLERRIAIIVHADPEGNGKLKNWGREAGVSVIPICAHTAIPSGEELERVLFSEFYSHDVFDVTGPVSDDSKFYGRRSEALDIARQLQSGQVRSCLGIRKVGKTSIIHRILDVAHAGHDCSSVMVDCQRDQVWQMSQSQLLESLARAVAQAVDDPRQYTRIQSMQDDVDLGLAADHLVAEIRRSPRPVLMFFDEVDYITPGSTTTDKWRQQFNPFWRNLRAAYQEALRTGAKPSLFISGVSSKWFRVESIEGVENAALAFIPEEYLSPLPTGASVAMIKTLARTAGLQFDTASAEHVAAECSNMPYWIRKACSHIHRKVPIEVRPYQLDFSETAAYVQAFIEVEGAAIAEVALSNLFRNYPELEVVAISVLLGQASRASAPISNVLEKYGVFARQSSGYVLQGQMMVQGLKTFVDNRSTPDPAQSSNLEFESMQEWAEELALLNASRNKVEKRLRSIVVNFMRFDILQNKQKGGLSERLLKAIEEPRRSKMRHLQADELVEKFNWSDLSRLVEQEWALFAAIFGDKSLFRQNAALVNIRYDAHAKDADRADVALYRRAIEWFSECISAV